MMVLAFRVFWAVVFRDCRSSTKDEAGPNFYRSGEEQWLPAALPLRKLFAKRCRLIEADISNRTVERAHEKVEDVSTGGYRLAYASGSRDLIADGLLASLDPRVEL